jgi:hypothetical protein
MTGMKMRKKKNKKGMYHKLRNKVTNHQLKEL